MKSKTFWDIMPCSPVGHWHFRETPCLHIWGQRVHFASNQQGTGLAAQTSACHLLPTAHLLGLFLEILRSSESSVNLYRTARWHILEDSTFKANILSLFPCATQTHGWQGAQGMAVCDHIKKDKAIPATGHGGPQGFETKAPTFCLESRHSAHRWR
jgi:hypothetical protein